MPLSIMELAVALYRWNLPEPPNYTVIPPPQRVCENTGITLELIFFRRNPLHQAGPPSVMVPLPVVLLPIETVARAYVASVGRQWLGAGVYQ